ncbi:MAG: ADP-ribosylglycohydrolase family protein, partial [Angelakisella sp.]
GYQELHVLLNEELDQRKEEGFAFDRSALQARIDAARGNQQALMAIYADLQKLPPVEDYPYVEPNDYPEILAASALGNTVSPPPEGDTLYDRFYGAWLGRCIGCALGQPVELWNHEGIETWCTKADAWPLANYMPTHSRAEAQDNMKLNSLNCSDEVMQFMPTDDDIRYTVLGLLLVQSNGSTFDSWDVANHWTRLLPFRFLCTAENQAYLNFCNLDAFGPWGVKPDNAVEQARSCATLLNPYREWIGAQIRIDAYGYVAAGNPHLAAKMAYEDAAFSHTKNGIYGAMFFAALIAAAFTEKNLDKAIAMALAEVPARSRFYEAAVRAVAIGHSATSRQEVIETIQREFGAYNAVHTINNAALCIAAMTYSKGDFEEALCLSVAGGMDTDCNGATVGSVMGALVGAAQIPAKWTAPLHDTLYSQLPDYHPIAISELAKRTMDTYIKLKA